MTVLINGKKGIMTTEEIIGKIKQRRKNIVNRSQSGLKQKLQEIRKDIVENSFNGSPDMDLHRDLIRKLEEVKSRLKQVNAFGG